MGRLIRSATRSARVRLSTVRGGPPACLPGELPAFKYRATMRESPLSAEDIRAAAEVHQELGPDYGDAVVESFLARIDQHIDARVKQQLGSDTRPRRRQIDPARLSKRRTVFAGAIAGSVVAGAPLTALAWVWLGDAGRGHKPLLWVWVAIVAVYGLAAYRLRRHYRPIVAR